MCPGDHRRRHAAHPRAGTSRYFDHYVYGLDGHIPLVRYRDTDANGSMDETQHYTWDANGNITSMLGLNGSVVERYTYEAYGRPSFWSGSWASRTGPAQGNRILFGAAYFQDRNTDLYFANARYYHSTLGRFISRDPLADAYQDGPNLYQYVGSNPINWVDPEGMQTSMPQGDLNVAWQLHADWSNQGFSFAADLLSAFLQNLFPAVPPQAFGNAGNAFQHHAAKVKADGRWKLPAYTALFTQNPLFPLRFNDTSCCVRVPDVLPRPVGMAAPAFVVSYAGLQQAARSDLAAAYGNAHFGWRNVTICLERDGRGRGDLIASGEMIATDLYTYGKTLGGLRLIHNDYRNLHDLQVAGRANGFWHYVTFDFTLRQSDIAGRQGL